MKPLFSLNILFTLLVTLGTTRSFPLHHLGGTKDLSLYRERRAPVLCWVVQVHARFKCNSVQAVGEPGSFLNDAAEYDRHRHKELDGIGHTNCTKQYYNEIAKELQLIVVHIFSKFSNHVLMCFQEEKAVGNKVTLANVHTFHPKLLNTKNKAAFTHHKNAIENRLISHREIISFHAEYSHQHKSRTDVPVKVYDDTIPKTVERSVQRLPSNFKKNYSVAQHRRQANLLQLNTAKTLDTPHLSPDASNTFSIFLRWLLSSNQISLCNIFSKVSSVFQDKSYVEKFLHYYYHSLTYQSNDRENRLCRRLINLLKTSKIVTLLQQLCDELNMSSSANYTLHIENELPRVEDFFASCINSLTLPPKYNHTKDALGITDKGLYECATTVIKSFKQMLYNGTIFLPAMDCRLTQSSSNCCAIFDESYSNKTLCVYCKQHLVKYLAESFDKSVTFSNDYQRLLSIYKRIVVVLTHCILCSSTNNSVVRNAMSMTKNNNNVKNVRALENLKRFNFKDASPFVQQFIQRKRSSRLSLLPSSTISSLLTSSIRRRRSVFIQSSLITANSFNDPAYPRQWHLHNVATPSMDVNVTSLWAKGYNGSGVTVAVVDDGLQWQNHDLKANYEYRGSWDFNDDDPDPTPSTEKLANHHGTRCAGEIAAVSNNSLCGVGVAYGAKVAGIRVLDGVMTDSLEAEAFNKAMQVNDVYSCSWGPDDDGKTVDGPHLMAARAMQHGVEFGRHGYGSIFVVASGNGGLHQDNCNFDGYANSIYTVTIGAVDESGLMPYYAEECASMLGVTFSSGTTNKRDIVTTDWTYHNPDGCTEKHTGTSAAAPLAAGMIALMLQARPCLTWRDVQFIIILTARKVDVDIAHWQTNGAGLSHSHKHGFGLLSSWRMVNAARVWKSVPWMTSFSHTDNRKLEIPKSRQTSAESRRSKSGEVAASLLVWNEVREEDIRGYSLFTLESVQVTVWLSHPCRGNLSIELVSPSKTVSVIAATRSNDNSSYGFQNWTFTTVRCWGESPVGNWTLEVKDKDNGKYGKGRLTKWRLTLFGSPMSRSEFDERRDLVESAMGGYYLDSNQTRPCPPTPPQKIDTAQSISEKTLKILLLCGIFCLMMGFYETFEYMCCYNEEKEEHRQEVEQMRTAQRMRERTLRVLENEYQSSSIPMTANSISNSTTRIVRTMNDLSSLSPINSSRFDANDDSNNSNHNTRHAVDGIDNSNRCGYGSGGGGGLVDEEEEDDLFDAVETSGLLNNGNDFRSSSSGDHVNANNSGGDGGKSQRRVPSSFLPLTLSSKPSNSSGIFHSIQNKLSSLSARISVSARSNNRSTHGSDHYYDKNGGGNENGSSERLHEIHDDDDDENDLFDTSLSLPNSKLLSRENSSDCWLPSKLKLPSPSSSSSPSTFSHIPNIPDLLPYPPSQNDLELDLRTSELTSDLARAVPSSSADSVALDCSHGLLDEG